MNRRREEMGRSEVAGTGAEGLRGGWEVAGKGAEGLRGGGFGLPQKRMMYAIPPPPALPPACLIVFGVCSWPII